MNKVRNHIELFAGCGGMAIGMESAGFELTFANEISPMASNTFAYNVLGVDITKENEKVKWVHSRYSREEYGMRLRENLLTHKSVENCEIDTDPHLNYLEKRKKHRYKRCWIPVFSCVMALMVCAMAVGRLWNWKKLWLRV